MARFISVSLYENSAETASDASAVEVALFSAYFWRV